MTLLVGWHEGHPARKKIWGDDGGGHWLVRMEWHPARWSVCLPPLISPCTIKSRSSLMAPAHARWSRKRVVKRLCVCVCDVYGAVIMPSHCESSLGSFDECRLSARLAAIPQTHPTNFLSTPRKTAITCIHYCHSLLMLSPKADTHFAIPCRVVG